MTITRASDAPTWDLAGTRIVGLASPSRGAGPHTAVWRVILASRSTGDEHRVTRTQVFAPVAGAAQVCMDGGVTTIGVGDALIVRAGTDFSLSNPVGEPFGAIACMPSGGQATHAGDDPFTPAWTT